MSDNVIVLEMDFSGCCPDRELKVKAPHSTHLTPQPLRDLGFDDKEWQDLLQGLRDEANKLKSDPCAPPGQPGWFTIRLRAHPLFYGCIVDGDAKLVCKNFLNSSEKPEVKKLLAARVTVVGKGWRKGSCPPRGTVAFEFICPQGEKGASPVKPVPAPVQAVPVPQQALVAASANTSVGGHSSSGPGSSGEELMNSAVIGGKFRINLDATKQMSSDDSTIVMGENLMLKQPVVLKLFKKSEDFERERDALMTLAHPSFIVPVLDITDQVRDTVLFTGGGGCLRKKMFLCSVVLVLVVVSLPASLLSNA